jgi:hypothetical protein
MSEIYIIHKTADDATATRIHFALNASGIDTWVDHIHGSEPQGPDSRRDEKALERCDIGLFVLSPASIASPKCARRWEAVLDAGKPLIIVLAESIPTDDLPDRLWDRQIPYVDLTVDAESGIGYLIQTVGGLVSS